MFNKEQVVVKYFQTEFYEWNVLLDVPGGLQIYGCNVHYIHSGIVIQIDELLKVSSTKFNLLKDKGYIII